MMHAKHKPAQVSVEKAKEVMRHGEVHGKPLTPAQRGMFGARAGGQKLTRLKKK